MRTSVRASRRSERIFDVTTSSQARFAVESGAYRRPGEAAGPAPMELMLASLVTCAADTIDDILAKMRIEVPALNLVAEGIRAEKAPRVFTHIHLEFQVASEAPVDRLDRAVALTERTCSASAMLSKVTAVESHLTHVRQVDAASTRHLRQRILRPHQTIDELAAEDAEDAIWFAALAGGDVVGTAALSPEWSPDQEGEAVPLRLRAMAVTEERRGRGLGRVMLDAALQRAWRDGATSVWCSARAPACGFYLDGGFIETSDTFDVEHIGPHVRMARMRP